MQIKNNLKKILKNLGCNIYKKERIINEDLNHLLYTPMTKLQKLELE